MIAGALKAPHPYSSPKKKSRFNWMAQILEFFKPRKPKSKGEKSMPAKKKKAVKKAAPKKAKKSKRK